MLANLTEKLASVLASIKGTPAMPKNPRIVRVTVYRDADGQYRLRLKARNGKVINDNYTRKRDADRAMRALKGSTFA